MGWSTELPVERVDRRGVVQQLQNEIKEWRIRVGYTQARASRHLGIAKATYNKWEKHGRVGAVGMWILAKYGIINPTDYR